MWLVILIILLIVVAVVFKIDFRKAIISPQVHTTATSTTTADIHDATFIIDGESITLKNGIFETGAILGSASKIVVKYFGNDVKHDFDGDGREDVAFIITKNAGGSGTFFYVVAVLNKATGLVGSTAVLLGDRIAPQTTNVTDQDTVVVNYADRKSTDSFATPPSVGKSLYLHLDTKTMQFSEVMQNIEGETSSTTMSLSMKKWYWVKTVYSDGKTITPNKPERFSLTFNKTGTVAVTTDCNGGGGTYSTSGNKLEFSDMMSTLMYCAGSQESEFYSELGQVQNFTFTSKGELVLGLKSDKGAITFK